MGIAQQRVLGAIIAGVMVVYISSGETVFAQSPLRAAISPAAPFGANPGFDANLIAIIADQAGFEVDIRIMPAEDILPALVAGEIDVAIEAAEPLDNHPSDVAYTQTAILNTGTFAVAANSTERFRSLAELQGRVVGATANTTWHQQLVDAGLREIRTYPDYAAAIAALIGGDIDAYYTNRAVILYRQHARGLDCGARVVDDYLNTDFPLARLAVRSADTELLAALNTALSEMRNLGVLFGGAFHYHPDDVHIAPLCQ